MLEDFRGAGCEFEMQRVVKWRGRESRNSREGMWGRWGGG